jgi:hypothetical protein
MYIHVCGLDIDFTSFSSILVWFMVLNATFNNISAISGWSVLLVEETGVPGENHRPVASHKHTLFHIMLYRVEKVLWDTVKRHYKTSKCLVFNNNIPVGFIAFCVSFILYILLFNLTVMA